MILVAGLASCASPGGSESPYLTDLSDQRVDPWADTGARAHVFLFTRTDCPIANRYAPEIRRLWDEFGGRGVRFMLVFVDGDENAQVISRHLADFQLPIEAVRDPHQELARLCGAKFTPECAVFDAGQSLVYCGRIDDRFVDLNKMKPHATTHELRDAIEAAIESRRVEISRLAGVGCPISGVGR